MSDQRWRVEKRRRGWVLIHTPTGLRISRRVPYPEGDDMPPVSVSIFRLKRDAVAHAQTLDWDDIERRMRHEGVLREVEGA